MNKKGKKRGNRVADKADLPQPPGRRWRWVAIGILGAAAFAISLVLLQASAPEALSLEEVLRAGGHLHALAVRPGKEGVEILLGTHHGLYVNADDGRTWKLASERTDFMAFAGSPQDRVFYAAGHDISVWRSLDGGRAWEKARANLPHHDVHAIGADPKDSSRAYAWVVGRGLFETKDAGKSWKLVNDRLARLPITSIIVPRNAPGSLLASSGAGILSSKDGGATWQPVQNELWGGPVFALLEVDGKSGWLLAGTEKGLFLRSDSSKSFQPVEKFLISRPVISLAQTKGGGSIYALTAEGKLFFSRDGGARWVGLQ